MIFACGPTPMLRAVTAWAEEQQTECWISMEERMACGIGACLACVCQSKEVDEHSQVRNKRVCKDGPVFLASEVELVNEYESKYSRRGAEESGYDRLRHLRLRSGVQRTGGSEQAGGSGHQGSGQCALAGQSYPQGGGGLRRHAQCHRPAESRHGGVLQTGSSFFKTV